MEDPIIQIKNLFNTVISGEWEAIHKIPQSGGDRIYFRIQKGNHTWIATFSLNIKENKTFIYFANHFKDKSHLSEFINSKLVILDRSKLLLFNAL